MNGEVFMKKCSYESGCDLESKVKGFCIKHYKRYNRGTLYRKFHCKNCGDEFEKVGSSQTYCKECFKKSCLHCSKDFIAKSINIKFCSNSCAGKSAGVMNTLPQFTKRYIRYGYVVIKVGKEWIREHRYVMERHLGRKLLKTEDVHHVNGIKDDNSISNLQVVQRDRHYGNVKCPHCLNSFKIK